MSATAYCAQPSATRTPKEPTAPVQFRWLVPTTWPVVPVPNISVNPTNGATIGIIPTWLQHSRHGEIVRILAPDVIHNANFGWGGHFRLLDYLSADTQWSVVAGAMQRVESNFDALYETGLMRQSRWSLTVEARYDRNGTARFFGIGNDSPHVDQSVFIDQQLWAQSTVGWNITHAWQLAYTLLIKKVRVIGGHLPGIASITSRFPHVWGLGTSHEVLHRVALIYDTRDDIRMPRHGVDIALYGGIASRNGSLTSSLYTEAGFDARSYWSPDASLTVATHVDLRYMPSMNGAPFWALSSIGGEHSMLGGRQTLRGFGDSRFYGRDSFSANIEIRHKLLTLDTLGTRIVLQIAPFYDTGRVFERASTLPIDKLHNVVGVGFRGIAAPFVVGYVDVGIGSEGVAVFTGIDYPF